MMHAMMWALIITITPGVAAMPDDPAYMGKPLSSWIESLRTRDTGMDTAFQAITTLGPNAVRAVPVLTQIVAEPFAPVKIGVDDNRTIQNKVRDIQLRANAVDALAAIGEGAASSAETLIQWGLTTRVIAADLPDLDDEELYIDLVGLDVLQRMRVAGTVALFGKDALLPISVSLAAGNDEERKLAVAILSEHAPVVAMSLLKSKECDARELGLSILIDMWPVVARAHLMELTNSLFVRCEMGPAF